MTFGRFFLPGPTDVRAEVLAAQAGPMLPHRGAEFEALFASLQVGLRAVVSHRAPGVRVHVVGHAGSWRPPCAAPGRARCCRW